MSGERCDLQVVVDGNLGLAEPGEGRLHLAGLDVLPTHESHGVVEQQVALGLATAHKQHGILVVLMLATEPLVIDVVQNVDVVYQDGLVVAEQSLRLLQSPTRLQQLGGLVADEDFLFTFVDMVDDLLGEVVNVDNKAVATGTSAFGIVSVRGFNRVPRPAARIIACFMEIEN